MEGRTINSNSWEVKISRILHRGSDRILLSYPFENPLNKQIKGIEGRRYSKTYRSWHLPYTKNSLIALKERRIHISVVEADVEDHLFQQFQEQIESSPSTQSHSDKTSRRIQFLIQSFDDSIKSQMKSYIHFLNTEGYSWNSIKLFSKFAALSNLGELGDNHAVKTLNLSDNAPEQILNKYLEFCKSR